MSCGHQPPPRTRRLLATIVRDRDGRALIDDLDELFAGDIEAGVARPEARRRYRRQAVLLAIRWRLHRSWHRGAAGSVGTGRPFADIGRRLWLASRRLAREPLFSGTVVLSLALGIGGNAVLLSLGNALWLAPLPFPAAEQIVHVWGVAPNSDRTPLSYPVIEDVRDRVTSMDLVTGFVSVGLGLYGEGAARRVDVGTVDAEFFEVLGIEPLLGRVLMVEDSAAEASNVVLSENLWRTHFGADPDIVGRTVRIETQVHEVVGVARMPAGIGTGFDPLRDWDLWWPVHNLRSAGMRGARTYAALARLGDGATVEQAEAELASVAVNLAVEHPQENGDLALRAAPLREDLFARLAPSLRLLLAAAVLVLVVAAINVANLLVVRAAQQRGVTWLQRALGASTAHLMIDALAEIGILVTIGSAVGLGVATLSLDALLTFNPVGVPAFAAVSINPRVVGGVALLASATAALIAALTIHRSRVTMARGWNSARTVSTDGGLVGRVLTTAQIAVAVVVVVGAGLLGRSFQALRTTDVGFETERLVVVQVPVPRESHPTLEQVVDLTERVNRRLEAVPGVLWAANHGSGLPGYSGLGLEVMAGPNSGFDDPAAEAETARFHRVSPGWLEGLGLPLVQGRTVSPADRVSDAPVVVVSESLAAALWPEVSPLGRSLRVRFPRQRTQPPPATVVGVIGDARNSGRIHRQGQVTEAFDFYLPWAQHANHFPQYVVRIAPGGSLPLAELRDTFAAVDPAMAVGSVRTVEEQMRVEERIPRFLAFLMTLFANVTLLLAGIGLHGVLAYTVARRQAELAVRRILGATDGSVVRLVLGQALGMAAVGLILGVGIALAGGRLARRLLYEISPDDPTSFGIAGLFLLAAVLVAALRPTLRAARVEPADILRAPGN